VCIGEVEVLSYTIKLLELKSLVYINYSRGFGYVIRCGTDGIVSISRRNGEVGNIKRNGIFLLMPRVCIYLQMRQFTLFFTQEYLVCMQCKVAVLAC
jgi:hypothetical protein